ncbi:MAG: site-specific DNA-methyltransferase [Actinomycetota bacterium]|nr:site-specific DNA-methyltransferase [Actinomycetota bacterium]
MRDRRRTSTSNFGVGRRESHDASGFYGRFRPPQLSADDSVAPPKPVAEPFVCADARSMDTVDDGSVALVVTSPPYFAGKLYEEELERDGVPSSYLEYLGLLTDVFAECTRTLEPGGRIAVNVANLGRKPYRSLSADVIRILEHELGLLLRGELIWHKAKGAGGSCAWGSFRGATNPVLRDVTERVIVASKGRFDRARSVSRRAAEGLPHRSTISADDFMASTLDVWSIPAEGARRVGHPAPFPVELPRQLIDLYTFEDDLVLDPFMGSGSTLVAATQAGRRYTGYDLDPDYVALARRRVDEAERELEAESSRRHTARLATVSGGDAANQLALRAINDAGFTAIERKRRLRGTSVTIDFVATDAAGRTWYFGVGGTSTSHRGGMHRSDVAWRWLGQASALRGAGVGPLVLLTTHVPGPSTEPGTALRIAGRSAFFDAIDVLSDAGNARLARYAGGGVTSPDPGFWS